jgi:nucleoside 2-deoxyribosyltransferase
MMKTIYLAGPYTSRDKLAEYRSQLIRIGYTVRARWLDGQHEVSVNPQVEADADPKERARWAREDFQDVTACDILVAFTSAAVGGGGTSGGRHAETGYALALGKRVILVGKPENVFHWLTEVNRVPDWNEAVIELAALLVTAERSYPRRADLAVTA